MKNKINCLSLYKRVKVIINRLYKNVSGIYCIKNNINNDIYIGSSKNVYNRLTVHKSELKHKKHDNIHLQNSVNKYGLNNFSCFLFCICNIEELIMIEDIFIKYLNPIFNKREACGTYLNDIIKKQISNTLKELYKNGLPVKCAKKVLVYDRETASFLMIGSSIVQTSILLKIHEATIRNVLSGKRKSALTYIFRYENDERPVQPIHLNKYNRKIKSLEIKENLREKSIRVIDIINNEEYKFTSYINASKFFNLKKPKSFTAAVIRYKKTKKPWRKQFIFENCLV